MIGSGVGAVAKFRSSCDLNKLKPAETGQNSFVYASDGSLLGSIPADKNRTRIALRGVSFWERRATVAIEDHRFYQHGGVDYQGIIRAAWSDLRAGHVVQGGSTIAQQLVRNLYISKERTFKRKIKEACLAIKLSRRWSKSRILSEYMNQVYYGNHAYGIEAAAQTYFSKHARNLWLAQAALLAGLPQAPSVYDPFHRPAAALARRDEVLRAMLQYGAVTPAQYREAVAQRQLHLKPGRLYTRIKEPYFFSYVRDQLISEYGANTVRTGGLRVYTTIDPRLQRVAVKAVVNTLYLHNDPAAAVVSISPATGAIRAMTAVTPGRTGNQFNLVAQARRLGITSRLDVVPGMGLGADAISPLEEASAFATLAAGGIYSKPTAIREVKLANGKVDTDAGWGTPQRKRVISDGVAYEVTRILQDNVLQGTGVGAYFGRPAAGKTGTTDNHADAWFSGFTPQLETTVWVGYPRGEIPMEDVHGSSVQGGTFPATIWKLFMEAALAHAPALDWRSPLNPVVSK